jgi:hypothetical protein
VAELVNDLRDEFIGKAAKISTLPVNAEYVFGANVASEQYPIEKLSVQKTRSRTVVSLEYSKFQSKEVIMEKKEHEKSLTIRSSKLASIVPSSAKYSFDLIAFVGKKCYLEGCKLKTVNAHIAKQHGLSLIPTSSLYDLQRKFLFYLGELHRSAIPEIKSYLRNRGNITWLIDGTIEPGSPVFFGVKEAYSGIFLKGWKIPTENEEDISKCLLEAAEHYGKPDEILHDLSERMLNSCEMAFPDRPHRVCQYHLCSDLGKDLYDVPQKMMNKRLRSIKLQPYLKNQRSSQTQRLRGEIKDPNVQLILKDLLNGKIIDFEFSDILAREILLGLHSWMLDYASDGHRQGFPFDPYLLYLHRRITKIHEVTSNLISRENGKNKLPRIYYSFSNRLESYLTDSVIADAANLYENAFQIFQQIREVLRLNAKGPSPMRDSYELDFKGKSDVRKSLNDLIEQFERSKRICSNADERNLYKIVLSHTKKYKPYLFKGNAGSTAETQFIRTTNGIETHWGSGKRLRRQTHGRMKLTRDFCALPAEYMLIPNLNNPLYVDLVLGSLERLPEKLAEAGKTSGSYSAWCKRQQPQHTGRLPKKTIRRETFIEDLVEIFEL